MNNMAEAFGQAATQAPHPMHSAASNARSAFTFGTLLTIYLAGLGLGAAIGSALLGRIKRPALGFLLLQVFIGLYAGLSVAAVVAAVGERPWLRDGAFVGGVDLEGRVNAGVGAEAGR